jgi:hypothetical protein
MVYSTQVFFLLRVIRLITELISLPLGSLLMKKKGANFAFAIGIIPRVLSLFVLLCVQERQRDDEETNSSPDATPERQQGSKLKRRLSSLVSYLRHRVLPLIASVPLLLGMLSLLVNNLALPIFEFLMQYMRVKFGWDYSDVSSLGCYKILHYGLLQSGRLHLLISSHRSHCCALHSVAPNLRLAHQIL